MYLQNFVLKLGIAIWTLMPHSSLYAQTADHKFEVVSGTLCANSCNITLPIKTTLVIGKDSILLNEPGDSTPFTKYVIESKKSAWKIPFVSGRESYSVVQLPQQLYKRIIVRLKNGSGDLVIMSKKTEELRLEIRQVSRRTND